MTFDESQRRFNEQADENLRQFESNLTLETAQFGLSAQQVENQRKQFEAQQLQEQAQFDKNITLQREELNKRSDLAAKQRMLERNLLDKRLVQEKDIFESQLRQQQVPMVDEEGNVILGADNKPMLRPIQEAELEERRRQFDASQTFQREQLAGQLRQGQVPVVDEEGNAVLDAEGKPMFRPLQEAEFEERVRQFGIGQEFQASQLAQAQAQFAAGQQLDRERLFQQSQLQEQQIQSQLGLAGQQMQLERELLESRLAEEKTQFETRLALEQQQFGLDESALTERRRQFDLTQQLQRQQLQLQAGQFGTEAGLAERAQTLGFLGQVLPAQLQAQMRLLTDPGAAAVSHLLGGGRTPAPLRPMLGNLGERLRALTPQPPTGPLGPQGPQLPATPTGQPQQAPTGPGGFDLLKFAFPTGSPNVQQFGRLLPSEQQALTGVTSFLGIPPGLLERKITASSPGGFGGAIPQLPGVGR